MYGNSAFTPMCNNDYGLSVLDDSFLASPLRRTNREFPESLLCLRGLLEGGFSRITTLRIIHLQILSYHELAFL